MLNPAHKAEAKMSAVSINIVFPTLFKVFEHKLGIYLQILGLQRRMVLHCFRIFIFCFVNAIFDVVHDTTAIFHLR